MWCDSLWWTAGGLVLTVAGASVNTNGMWRTYQQHDGSLSEFLGLPWLPAARDRAVAVGTKTGQVLRRAVGKGGEHRFVFGDDAGVGDDSAKALEEPPMPVTCNRPT